MEFAVVPAEPVYVGVPFDSFHYILTMILVCELEVSLDTDAGL